MSGPEGNSCLAAMVSGENFQVGSSRMNLSQNPLFSAELKSIKIILLDDVFLLNNCKLLQHLHLRTMVRPEEFEAS